MASSKHCVYKEFVTNSESPLCSQVGKRILEDGGNAVDAAIATAICVGVVNSFSSGIGGGGFILIREVVNGKDSINMIDFRETAPQAININELQRNRSKEGPLSVATPGEILGFYEAHKKYGKLPWKRLFKENVAIAMGFRASAILIKKLNKNKDYILRDEGLRKIYTVNGELIKEGFLVKRDNYAKTLEILSEDPLSFYNGKIADQIVKSITSMGGVLSKTDLAEYKTQDREILQSQFKDYAVYTSNLPTSGILIIEALNLLEQINFEELRKLPEEDKLFRFYKILIHIFKAISEKRGELGDPDFVTDINALVNKFISPDALKISADKFSIFDQLYNQKYNLTAPYVEDHGTTHLEVVDRDGMIVQITSTINLEFGAKIMDPETGIIFNNQIDDFYIPNVKNAYDLPEMPGNILKQGKRPVSSAAPVFLIKDDEVIAIGATGGSRIPSAIVGTLAYWIMGYSLEEAISSVRIHNQLSPNITYVENTFPKSTWKKLEESGENIEESETNSIFTSVQAIQITKKNSDMFIHAVADYRKGGEPAGI